MVSSKCNFTFVVVTYNSAQTIADCLDALLRQISPTDDILVFDNCSSDATRTILKNYESQATIYLAEANFGFSYACNAAASHSTAAYYGFVNPDAIVGNGLLNMARGSFLDEPYGLVGFNCIGQDGCRDRNYKRYPSVLSGMLTIFDELKSKLVPGFDSEFNLGSHYLDGSCFFIDKVSFYNAGKFPNFFLYGEDVLLCDRLRENGIQAIYHNEISYTHLRGSSSNNEVGERAWGMLPNMVYSELYFMRNKKVSVKLTYLACKYIELGFMVLVSQVVFRKNKVKKTFYEKRLKLFLRYSKTFCLDGADFFNPDFHQSDSYNSD